MTTHVSSVQSYTGGRPLQQALAPVFQKDLCLARASLGRELNANENQQAPYYTALHFAELLQKEEEQALAETEGQQTASQIDRSMD